MRMSTNKDKSTKSYEKQIRKYKEKVNAQAQTIKELKQRLEINTTIIQTLTNEINRNKKKKHTEDISVSSDAENSSVDQEIDSDVEISAVEGSSIHSNSNDSNEDSEKSDGNVAEQKTNEVEKSTTLLSYSNSQEEKIKNNSKRQTGKLASPFIEVEKNNSREELKKYGNLTAPAKEMNLNHEIPENIGFDIKKQNKENTTILKNQSQINEDFTDFSKGFGNVRIPSDEAFKRPEKRAKFNLGSPKRVRIQIETNNNENQELFQHLKPGEIQESKEIIESNETKEVPEIFESKEIKEISESAEINEIPENKEMKVQKNVEEFHSNNFIENKASEHPKYFIKTEHSIPKTVAFSQASDFSEFITHAKEKNLVHDFLRKFCNHNRQVGRGHRADSKEIAKDMKNIKTGGDLEQYILTNRPGIYRHFIRNINNLDFFEILSFYLIFSESLAIQERLDLLTDYVLYSENHNFYIFVFLILTKPEEVYSQSSFVRTAHNRILGHEVQRIAVSNPFKFDVAGRTFVITSFMNFLKDLFNPPLHKEPIKYVDILLETIRPSRSGRFDQSYVKYLNGFSTAIACIWAYSGYKTSYELNILPVIAPKTVDNDPMAYLFIGTYLIVFDKNTEFKESEIYKDLKTIMIQGLEVRQTKNICREMLDAMGVYYHF